MSDLDDKLREILQSLPSSETGDSSDDEWKIAQIHQAYKDAGWTEDLYRKHFNDAYISGIKESANFMTGQEFYDRFKAEVVPDFEKFILEPDTTGYVKEGFKKLHEAYLEAARRAAGISENQEPSNG
jgi:hypothetical protein